MNPIRKAYVLIIVTLAFITCAFYGLAHAYDYDTYVSAANSRYPTLTHIYMGHYRTVTQARIACEQPYDDWDFYYIAADGYTATSHLAGYVINHAFQPNWTYKIYWASFSANSLDNDNDGDGVVDSSDDCSGSYGSSLADGTVDSSGCPIIDTDEDGIPDDYDYYPNDPTPYNWRLIQGYFDADGNKIGTVLQTDRSTQGRVDSHGDPLLDFFIIGNTPEEFMDGSWIDLNPDWISSAESRDDYEEFFQEDYPFSDAPFSSIPSDFSDPPADWQDWPDTSTAGGTTITTGATTNTTTANTSSTTSDTSSTKEGDVTVTGDGTSADVVAAVNNTNSNLGTVIDNQTAMNDNLKTIVGNQTAQNDNLKTLVENQGTTNTNLGTMITNQGEINASIGTMITNQGTINSNAQTTAEYLGEMKDINQGILDELKDGLDVSVLTGPDGETDETLSKAELVEVLNDPAAGGFTGPDIATYETPALSETFTTATESKFTTRFEEFKTNIRDSGSVAQVFDFMETVPTGSGSSAENVNIGKWGRDSDNYVTNQWSDYTQLFVIVQLFLWVVTGIAIFKIVVAKHA